MKTYKTTIIFFVIIFSFSCSKKTENNSFNKFFTNNTMRIDYFHKGNAKSEKVSLDQVYKYTGWAGSLTHLIDSLNNGAYYYKIYDKASNNLIYSKGFNSYFEEYQTSSDAAKGKVKKFQESAIIPMPKKDIIFTLDKRNKKGDFDEVYRTTIKPGQAEKAKNDSTIQIFNIRENGDPHHKEDIVFVGEGYTIEESDKFYNDLERFANVLLNKEPFKDNSTSFNIRGVLKPSQDSGIDEPRAGIYKNTTLNASFNTMGSERYVLIEDNKTLRDIAGLVPYDAIFIMINSKRYGGGGIYNFYCTFTTDNVKSEYIMVHEQGHSAYGLGDEYYTSSTAYTDFYNNLVEPPEPNISIYKDPKKVKWSKILSDSIEAPTPWEKEEYDSLDLAWQKRRAQLNNEIFKMQKNSASEKEIALATHHYDEESLKHDTIIHNYLAESKYAGKVGIYEGAGYMSKGMYRGSLDCIMFSCSDKFCPVCQEAIKNIIRLYSE